MALEQTFPGDNGQRFNYTPLATSGRGYFSTEEKLRRIVTRVGLGTHRSLHRFSDSYTLATDFRDTVEKVIRILPEDVRFSIEREIKNKSTLGRGGEVILNLTQSMLGSFLTSSTPFEIQQVGNKYDNQKIHIGLNGEDYLLGKLYYIKGAINGRKILAIKNNIEWILRQWGNTILILHNESEIEKLNILAYTDLLTGVKNRRSLFHEGMLSSEYLLEKDVYYLVVDIDHFKAINDAHGHPVGDFVLQEFCKEVGNICKEYSATIYRYGGEEFAIIGSGDILFAKKLAEKIRKTTENMKLSYKSDRDEAKSIPFRVSIGGSIIEKGYPKTVSDIENSLKRADIALYHSKETGRNKTSFSTEMCRDQEEMIRTSVTKQTSKIRRNGD